MPVVVRARDHERWLDCRHNDPAAVADILEAANDDFFTPVRISDRVNKVANSGPDLQEALADGAAGEDGERGATEADGKTGQPKLL